MAILSRFLGGVVASYTGVGGTAVVLDLGFVPAYATGIDQADGFVTWYWCNAFGGVTGGSTATGLVASSSVVAGLGTIATIAAGAGGIIALDGSAGTGIGLTIGTDTSINRAGHGVIVFAHEPM